LTNEKKSIGLKIYDLIDNFFGFHENQLKILTVYTGQTDRQDMTNTRMNFYLSSSFLTSDVEREKIN
jgi:hypothetical protein